jgi:hypothetical protein
MTCSAIHNCINDSLWAVRFSNTFDPLPLGVTAGKVSKEYKYRKAIASLFINFNAQNIKRVHYICAKFMIRLIRGEFTPHPFVS